jgi:hypothetical protein
MTYSTTCIFYPGNHFLNGLDLFPGHEILNDLDLFPGHHFFQVISSSLMTWILTRVMTFLNNLDENPGYGFLNVI